MQLAVLAFALEAVLGVVFWSGFELEADVPVAGVSDGVVFDVVFEVDGGALVFEVLEEEGEGFLLVGSELLKCLVAFVVLGLVAVVFFRAYVGLNEDFLVSFGVFEDEVFDELFDLLLFLGCGFLLECLCSGDEGEEQGKEDAREGF